MCLLYFVCLINIVFLTLWFEYRCCLYCVLLLIYRVANKVCVCIECLFIVSGCAVCLFVMFLLCVWCVCGIVMFNDMLVIVCVNIVCFNKTNMVLFVCIAFVFLLYCVCVVLWFLKKYCFCVGIGCF